MEGFGWETGGFEKNGGEMGGFLENWVENGGSVAVWSALSVFGGVLGGFRRDAMMP